MQKIYLFISLAVISISLHGEQNHHSCNEGKVNGTEQKREVTEGRKDPAFWNNMAEGMSRALIAHFWGANFTGYPDRYYFNYGSDLSNMATNHYWPQAHAMDVVVDAYLRTSNQYYLNFYPLWWAGAPKFNFSGRAEDPWWNLYVDDM